MERYGIDILGLSETHKRENGHQKTDNGNMLIMASNGERSRNGVAFIVNKNIERAIIGYNTVSDRIISIKINARPCTVNMIQVYAPTSKSTEGEIEDFYNQLSTTMMGIPSNEIIMVQRDFNAKIGSTNGDPLCGTTVGKFGLGKRNERGDKLLDFCLEKRLTVMNTWFQNHPRRLYTWKSPGDRHRNQIDFICIQTRWRSAVSDAKTCPGADCGTDHLLLTGNFKLRPKLIRKCNGVMAKLESSELRQLGNEIRPKLRTMRLNEEDPPDVDWRKLKETIIQTAREARGSRETRVTRKPWIQDRTWKMITDRRSAKSQGDNQRYRTLHREVKHACRRDKNRFINEICEEIEQHANDYQPKDLFAKVRQLTRQSKLKTWAIDDNQGRPLSSLKEVLNRWREYCEELYKEEEGERPRRKSLENVELEPEILLVEDVLRKLKKNAVGNDGISVEILRELGDDGVRILHKICMKVWQTGEWPYDWSESILIPLHKKAPRKTAAIIAR